MSFKLRYIPPDPTCWQGRKDLPAGGAFYQIIQMLNLLEEKPIVITKPAFALIGFKCDEGVRRNLGRVGAAEGPEAIRQNLVNIAVHKTNFDLYDVGNIVCSDKNLEAAQTALAEVVMLLLQRNIKPIVIGGGHELAYGHYQGIAGAYPQKNLGIVNFDAHFDMRPLLPNNEGSSGTPFSQIAQAHQESKRRFDYNCIGIQHATNMRELFERAKIYDTKIILADELHQGQLEKCVDFIDRIIDQNEIIYVSLCMDVFAVSFAPAVSAIQPLGLTPWHVIPLVRQLAASGKVVSYDIAELCPRYDIDQRTAKLAAHLIYEIVHHHHEPYG